MGGLWARLSAGFREDIYIYICQYRESGQRGAGSGEVEVAVTRERMEIESRIHRFGTGRPFAS